MLPKSSTLRADMLRKYLNEVFIETGTYEGGGVAAALEAGFPKVYSIEIAPRLYQIACKHFEGDPRVTLFLGDSSIRMREILNEVTVPATFWIDAHLPQDGTQHLPIWGNNPVLFELVAIAQHRIKTHTIIFDDMNDYDTSLHDNITVVQLKAQCLSINPAYQFTYENGRLEKSILVAQVPV
jgi:hypothetical protein